MYYLASPPNYVPTLTIAFQYQSSLLNFPCRSNVSVRVARFKDMDNVSTCRSRSCIPRETYACVRACVHACVRACVRACVSAFTRETMADVGWSYRKFQIPLTPLANYQDKAEVVASTFRRGFLCENLFLLYVRDGYEIAMGTLYVHRRLRQKCRRCALRESRYLRYTRITIRFF